MTESMIINDTSQYKNSDELLGPECMGNEDRLLHKLVKEG